MSDGAAAASGGGGGGGGGGERVHGLGWCRWEGGIKNCWIGAIIVW